jgi:hypothetical protein
MTSLILNQELPDFLVNAGVSELTKKLAGNTGVKRIVPKNGIFRKEIGGKEMGKVKEKIDTIVINASAHVGRIYYAQAWSPENEPTSPECFSNDGKSPDAEAVKPQSDKCDSCQHNIKGSGQGNSKSCRYSRRIAIMLKEDFGTPLEGEVYQMNLASKSLFGDSIGENTHMFENYAKYLANNGKSLEYVNTQISFNEDNDNQSVLFTPVGFINKHEFGVVTSKMNLPYVQKMITMTAYHADMSGRTPKLEAPKPKPSAKATPTVEDAFEEPKKRPSAIKEVTVKPDLQDVVNAWSDAEE